MTLHQQLMKLLQDGDLTHEQIAEEAGVSRQLVTFMAQGARTTTGKVVAAARRLHRRAVGQRLISLGASIIEGA